MERVMVLMSTYNGEKYLDVQIQSILNQEGVKVDILIRDDGSTDNTRSILHKYADIFANITVLEESNCGAIQSFYKLMEYAVRNFPHYNYFAFSDQDDYWYPTKLERAVSCNKDKSTNYFYHSCYHVVDDNLNIVTHSNKDKSIGTLGEALIANQAIGCSEVFTFTVLKNASNICNYVLQDGAYYPYHDLWIYLVALTTKADICFDEECGLKYRQHSNNVIGTGKSKSQTLKFQWHNLHKSRNIKSGFAKILLDSLTVENDVKELLEIVSGYRASFFNKIRLLRRKEFYIKDMTTRLAFFYSVLCGLY